LSLNNAIDLSLPYYLGPGKAYLLNRDGLHFLALTFTLFSACKEKYMEERRACIMDGHEKGKALDSPFIAN